MLAQEGGDVSRLDLTHDGGDGSGLAFPCGKFFSGIFYRGDEFGAPSLGEPALQNIQNSLLLIDWQGFNNIQSVSKRCHSY